MSDMPLNGAGSSYVDPEYRLRPYKVLCCDRFEPDIRFSVRIAAALGPHDAKNQARELYPNASVLKAEVA